MVRKKDRFWEYVEKLNGHFKCKFCERDFAEGVPRIKLHLAGVKGCDIGLCTKVPDDVQAEAYYELEDITKNLSVHQIQVMLKRSILQLQCRMI